MPGIAVSAGVFLLFCAGLAMALSGHAGPDPAKWLLHRSGLIALCFLVATIAVATLRRVLSRPAILRWRRPLGLAAFFFATTHVVVYLTVFRAFDIDAIADDVLRRSYILLGLLAWLLLVPLAVTSTARARRNMGARWYALHRVLYLLILLAIIHQGMAQKADLGTTLLFTAMIAILLAEKFVWRRVAPGRARG